MIMYTMAYGRFKPGTWPDYGLVRDNILTDLIKAYDSACCTLIWITAVKYRRQRCELGQPSAFNIVRLSGL